MAEFEAGGVDQQGSGAESPAAATFTDDTMFQPPGATAPVRFGDWQKGYVATADHEKVRGQVATQQQARQLVERAEQIDRARAAQQQGAAPQQAQDPLAEVRGKQFVSGDMISNLVTQVQDGNIKPLQQWALAVNKILADNAKTQQGLQGKVQGYDQERQTQHQTHQIRGLTDGAVKHAGFDLTSQEYAPVAEDLRALAEDHYFAFEPGAGQSRADFNSGFPARFAERLTSLRTAFRQLDRLESESARQRLIPGRGGNANPSGNAKRGFMTPSQRAEAFFPTSVHST